MNKVGRYQKCVSPALEYPTGAQCPLYFFGKTLWMSKRCIDSYKCDWREWGTKSLQKQFILNMVIRHLSFDQVGICLKNKKSWVHPLSIDLILTPGRKWAWESIPADFWQEAKVYTLDWLPANRRAHVDKHARLWTIVFNDPKMNVWGI